MMELKMKNFYLALAACGNFLQSLVLLAMRLYWGGSFFLTGMGKLNHIPSTADFFSSLGVPFPTFHAYFVSSIECVGGLCLFLGLASRLASIPLMGIMAVAFLTAHHDALVNVFNDPQNFISQLPFNYFLTALLVFVFGPGKISLDFLIEKQYAKGLK